MNEVLGGLMQFGDRPFAQGAYYYRLNELASIGYDVTEQSTIDNAVAFALERVFQNNSELAKRVIKARNQLGELGSLILPFAQTPANIADKLLDYNPLTGGIRLIKQKSNGTRAV